MTSSHDDYQRSYYTGRPLPRMTVDLAATPYVERHVDEVVAALGVEPGATVLDVGCGLGKYTANLADRGLRVTGLDLTPALVEGLRAARPDLEVIVGDAADPPAVLSGRFDAVTGFFVLHHVADVAAVFGGARRVLRPGGVAAFLEPNPLYLPFYLQIAFTPGMTWRGERGILGMTESGLSAAARRAGFVDVTVRAFGAAPPAVANRRWGRRVEGWMERIPGWGRVGAFRLVRMR